MSKCYTDGCENDRQKYDIECWDCAVAAAKRRGAEARAAKAQADAAIVPVVENVRLPAKFYDDHADRGCPSGRIVRRTARSVWVDLDQAALDDLRGDAEHYVDVEDYDRDLRSAARSMLAALDRISI